MGPDYRVPEPLPGKNLSAGDAMQTQEAVSALSRMMVAPPLEIVRQGNSYLLRLKAGERVWAKITDVATSGAYPWSQVLQTLPALTFYVPTSGAFVGTTSFFPIREVNGNSIPKDTYVLAWLSESNDCFLTAYTDSSGGCCPPPAPVPPGVPAPVPGDPGTPPTPPLPPTTPGDPPGPPTPSPGPGPGGSVPPCDPKCGWGQWLPAVPNCPCPFNCPQGSRCVWDPDQGGWQCWYSNGNGGYQVPGECKGQGASNRLNQGPGPLMGDGYGFKGAKATFTSEIFTAAGGTMAEPGTTGNVMTSDGTSWLSSAPSGGGGTSSTVTTTDATATTIATITLTSNTANLIDIDVVGVNTGATGGTHGDMTGYRFSGNYNCPAGTAGSVGITATINSGASVFSSLVAVSLSGATVVVKVTGVAASTYNWKCTYNQTTIT